MTVVFKRLEARTKVFTYEDVNPEIKDYAGQILVLDMDNLKDKWKEPRFQLFKAVGGFGCDPTALGRAVFAIPLSGAVDGESERWNRDQFLGVLKEEVVKELLICPGCYEEELHEDEAMNSLSRKDNETYICDRCGVKEAMEELGDI